MLLTKSAIPKTYQNIFQTSFKKYFLLYNPLSFKGLSVLDKKAWFLYSQINNKKTLGQIFKSGLKKDPGLKFSHIKKTFQKFLSSQIIYFNRPLSSKSLYQKKPTGLGVWLHVTNQCNLRCSYCYVYKNSEKMSLKTGFKAIEKIFLSAKKHGFEKITFKFSGGEALLEFKTVLKLVAKAKKLAKKYQIKPKFVILTNGVLLTPKICQILKQKNISAAVSLDGLGKYHDKTRKTAAGQPTFSLVEQGIKNLQKAKVVFNISITITAKNIVNVPELTKYCLKQNIPFVYNFYRENPYVKEKLESDDQKMIFYLRAAYRLIQKNPPLFSLLKALLNRVILTGPHLHACGMGNSYLVIDHHGRLSPCQTIIQKSIGSIDSNDLIEAMRNGDPTHGLTVDQKTSCKKCLWRYVCAGGCPLLSKSQKGSYKAPTPYCTVYKALIPEVLKVEAARIVKYSKI